MQLPISTYQSTQWETHISICKAPGFKRSFKKTAAKWMMIVHFKLTPVCRAWCIHVEPSLLHVPFLGSLNWTWLKSFHWRKAKNCKEKTLQLEHGVFGQLHYRLGSKYVTHLHTHNTALLQTNVGHVWWLGRVLNWRCWKVGGTRRGGSSRSFSTNDSFSLRATFKTCVCVRASRGTSQSDPICTS